MREGTEDAGYRKLRRGAGVKGAVDVVAMDTHAQRAFSGEGVADTINGTVVVALVFRHH